MSFYASNDRIRITDNAGKIVFDTAKPMPHIIQRITKSISVSFPNIPCKWRSIMMKSGPSILCQRREYQYVCRQTWVCKPVQQCGMVRQPDGTYSYECETVTRCGYENVCGNEWVTINGNMYDYDSKYTYEAVNWSTIVDIGAITGGLAADFLLVNAVADRTAQGELLDSGKVPCGLPLGQTFVANNSSIIETASDVSNGQPWMTRIMSIFVESGRIKAEFKHSNRGFEARSKWSGNYCEGAYGTPPLAPGAPSSSPSAVSSYSFDLDIVVGKFTI